MNQNVDTIRKYLIAWNRDEKESHRREGQAENLLEYAESLVGFYSRLQMQKELGENHDYKFALELHNDDLLEELENELKKVAKIMDDNFKISKEEIVIPERTREKTHLDFEPS